MSPQEKPKDATIGSSSDAVTRVVSAAEAPTYVECRSRGPFAHPTAAVKTAQLVNREDLNLNLGLPWDLPNNKTLLWMIRFLDSMLIQWWEGTFFRVWNAIPLAVRRFVARKSWKIYFFLVKRLTYGRGIHRDASPEYHALSCLLWWGQLIPVSIKRMRFSLEQLAVNFDDPVAHAVEKIEEVVTAFRSRAPEVQAQHQTVSGYYVNLHPEPTEYTILWIYGGAYLSGDAKGNLGAAAEVGREAQMDVFVPSFRLVPEANVSDIVWDICLAYWWLCQRVQGPSKIVINGISSGGGLCIKLLQAIAQYNRGEEDQLLPNYIKCFFQVGTPLTMPAGAALMGPFVDYTEPSGCFLPYSRHDLIVTQRVLDAGLPHLETQLGSQRRLHSPVYQSMQGLPPLCVVTSRHEAVYDQAILLVNRAREAGVDVTVGVWDYMCHVWTFLPMVPEGRQSMSFLHTWLRTVKQT